VRRKLRRWAPCRAACAAPGAWPSARLRTACRAVHACGQGSATGRPQITSQQAGGSRCAGTEAPHGEQGVRAGARAPKPLHGAHARPDAQPVADKHVQQPAARRAPPAMRERTQSLPSGVSLRRCCTCLLCCGSRGQRQHSLDAHACLTQQVSLRAAPMQRSLHASARGGRRACPTSTR